VMLPQGPQTMYWDNPNPPSGITKGNGPPVEVHVNYDTARFALPVALNSYRGGNSKEFVNEDLVKALITQEGNRRWVTFADQIIGQVSFAFSREAKKLRPTGPVSDVRFTIDKTGALRMNFTAAPISEGRDIRNTLESEVLETIFKQVHFNVQKGTR